MEFRVKIDRDRVTAFLMLLPSLILLAIFVYGFIGRTAYISLTDWGMNRAQALAQNPEIAFIGFENYRDLFTSRLDARFRQDLVNTFFFTIFFLAGCLGLGLGLAVLLEQQVRGEGIFRTIFLFPFALAFIVTGTIWRWMLQPQGGVNILPTYLGLPAGEFRWVTSRTQIWQFDWQNLPFYTGLLVTAVLLWLTLRALRRDRRRAFVIGGVAALLAVWTFSGERLLGLLPLPGARALEALPRSEIHGFNVAFVGITLAAVWQMSGYTMALYLASLRGIPDALREAARVDGASEFQVYRHVILPLLGPVTLSAMIILGHISLKIFDLIWVMAGVDNATTDVPALLMYLRSFRGNQFAEGAAIAMVLLLLVALIIVPYLRSSLRGEVSR